MGKLRLRPVAAGDVETVAHGMRAPDVAECAWHGYGPLEALRLSVDLSPECWTAVLDDAPVAVCGLSPLGDGRMAPWLLATDAVERVPVAVARLALHTVRKWSTEYDLANVADAANEKAIALLRWIGFSLVPRDDRAVDFHLMRRG